MDKIILYYPMVKVNRGPVFMEKTTVLCERLKISRESVGISKAEAARRLGLTMVGYCRYEYGDRTPSSQTLNVIAQCFNTSVDYLIGKTDDPIPDNLVINKTRDPELYRLIELCKKDDSFMKRIISYYQGLQ